MKPGTPPLVGQLIDIALEEDLGRGDITTRLCVPQDALATGNIIAKEFLVLSGLDVFIEVMKKVDPEITIIQSADSGTHFQSGDVIAKITGKAASLLMGERVALNFLQRLCGTATLTQKFIKSVSPNTAVRLVDTRKTTPGMRFLEREAVLAGGGNNHRVDLGGGILIKENHIEAAGSLTRAVELCKTAGPHPLKVEIEVTNQKELRLALEAKADIIMLDNMTTTQIKECLTIINGRALVEASGGINLETVKVIADTGVDIISVGAFTHSAPCSDISFLIDLIK